MHYYSTFISGLQDPVRDALKQIITSVKIDLVLDGIIVYSTNEKLDRLKNIDFFNNTFSLFRIYRDTKVNPIEDILSRIQLDISLEKEVSFLRSQHNRTFRIICSMENELVSVDNNIMIKTEQFIQKATGLKMNRAKPDFEFWIYYRSEKIGFFSLRITKHTAYEKILERGELRPQLSYMLNWLSEPINDELFLDPFCGSGSICISRTKFTRKGLIIASDCDEEKILKLKQKVKNFGLKNRLVVRKDNALNLDRYMNNAIDRIVTDPPWGFFEEIENINEFYKTFLSEIYRITKLNGIIVLLIAQESLFENNHQDYEYAITIIGQYKILVSGKKASIYKLKKINNL